MKRIPYVILISLLLLSGCQSQPGNDDPTAKVGSITDDVPEINIPEKTNSASFIPEKW